MRLDYITSAIGLALMYFSVTFIFPSLTAVYYGDYYAIYPFILSAAFTYAVGAVFHSVWGARRKFDSLKKKEALCIVAFAWILISLSAAIPFLFFGFSFADAVFESSSAITTCGASVITDFSLYPKAVFFWRSFCHWIGGLGIIVLFIAILPQFAVAGRQMFFAESANPNKEKLAPRMQYNALNLLLVYFLLSILSVFFLYVAGMPLFDAVCNSFSMISAGGLSPNQDSIAGYKSNAIVWICIVFMFLGGTNFALQYKVIFHRNFKSLFKSSEFRAYFFIILIASLVISIFITLDEGLPSRVIWIDNFRDALFHTVSLMTSTGFYSTNHDEWDAKAKIILMFLVFIGPSAGSAGGGIKVIRIIYVLKFLKREFILMLHPKAVIPIKLDKAPVSPLVGQQILSFVFFYFLIFAVIAMVVSMIEDSVLTGLIASATSIGNTGLGFDSLGPSGNFSHLSAASKFILSFAMIIGRLELIPMLVMFNPDYWRLASSVKDKKAPK